MGRHRTPRQRRRVFGFTSRDRRRANHIWISMMVLTALLTIIVYLLAANHQPGGTTPAAPSTTPAGAPRNP